MNTCSGIEVRLTRWPRIGNTEKGADVFRIERVPRGDIVAGSSHISVLGVSIDLEKRHERLLENDAQRPYVKDGRRPVEVRIETILILDVEENVVEERLCGDEQNRSENEPMPQHHRPKKRNNTAGRMKKSKNKQIVNSSHLPSMSDEHVLLKYHWSMRIARH